MRRRDVLQCLGGAAALLTLMPRALRAQQVRRVGVLMAGESNGRAPAAALVQALGQLGWAAGKNLQLDIRWSEAAAQRARALAAELVALAPDAILAATTGNLTAARLATRTIPIVFTQVSDPVVQGFVPSLMRPGGNITGFANYEFSIGGKWLDLLKQMVPALTRVAVMFNPEAAPQSRYFLPAIKAAGTILGVQVMEAPVHSTDEIESAIAEAARQPNSGLLFPNDAYLSTHAQLLSELVARHRLPAITGNRFSGPVMLMYYGQTDVADQYRGAATYIDRILKGERPGDLPVQLPSKFSLSINLKVARALGIEVPISLLLIADEQIE